VGLDELESRRYCNSSGDVAVAYKYQMSMTSGGLIEQGRPAEGSLGSAITTMYRKYVLFR